MSCIVGRFAAGGSGAMQHELQVMLAAARPRAPDGDSIHVAREVALGQAFLRTGNQAAEQENRLTLDGHSWIAADARIDGRGDLLRRLRSAGRAVDEDAPHAELILHAFHAFGDDFLRHLLGDFAFALWDGRKQRLICARDHFGVRPLYFAKLAQTFAFASDIRSLLALPGIRRDLDKTAVADFLLVGMCMEAQQTIYTDIRCLPPASRIDVSAAGPSVSRYWSLPVPRETRYVQRSEYVEHFHEIFHRAVTDRTPGADVALQMSGGMDSTAISAAASPPSLAAGHRATAYHVTCRTLLPADEEWKFAGLVAAHLGIPLVCRDVADQPLFGSHEHQLDTPFPIAYPHLGVHRATMEDIVLSGARVVLSGYGGDAAMSPSHAYYAGLLRDLRIRKFLREAQHHIVHAKSVRGMSLRSILPSTKTPPPWKPRIPDWVDPALIDERELASRWDRWWNEYQNAVDARRQLQQPWVQRQFEVYEVHAVPVQVRYPFQDIRLVEFLLSVPNFMLADKAILREAMRGRLPEAVRTREKTPLVGDPARAMVTGSSMATLLLENAAVPGIILRDKYERMWRNYLGGFGTETTWWSWLVLHPVALQNWLCQSNSLNR